MKSILSKFTLRPILILLIQMIVSIFLMYYIVKIGFFPISIVLLIGLVLLFIFLMMLLLQKSKRRIVFLTGTIISIVISILLSFAGYYVFKGQRLINSITDIEGRTTTLSVITLNDAPYDALSDYSGILRYAPISSSLINDNAEHYTKDHNITLESSENNLTLGAMLINGEVDAILIDEAQRSFIEENLISFSSDTKIIDQLVVSLPDENAAKNIDITRDVVNIYISGIDTFGDPSVASRTDSNMLLTYNPKTGSVLLTSIPRDYYVPFSCLGGAYDKFTHSGLYGIDCSVGTLEQLFGIDINYYVRVNFTGFINIIDALGGIEVYSPVAFTTSGGRYSFIAGTQTMNSSQALAFSRERYNLPGGDNDRVANQQRVVIGILNKVASPAILQDFGSFANSISGSISTNMPADVISALVRSMISGGQSIKFDTTAVTGYGINTTVYSIPGMQVYAMVPNQESVDAAIIKIRSVMNGE